MNCEVFQPMTENRSYGEKWKSFLLTFALFCFFTFLSFAVRTYHYNCAVEDEWKIIQDVPASTMKAEQRSFFEKFFPYYHKNFSPFTIESAMMFSYAQDIANGRGVPKSDPLLPGAENMPPYAQMSMGLEWFLAYGWKVYDHFFPSPAPTKAETFLQDNPRMAIFMSTLLRLWASLTTGFIFLFIVVCGFSRLTASYGAILHAFSLAAIARATGQDIVRGEFCIPLIMASLLLAYFLYRKHGIAVRIIACELLFAATFLAFATWDLCQMLFGFWAVYEIFRFLIGGRMTGRRFAAWATMTSAALLAALTVPCCVAYELIRSTFVCVALPTLFVCFLVSHLSRKKSFSKVPNSFVRLAVVVIIPTVLFFTWKTFVDTPEYDSIYSHFSETMKAKIAFNNVKPADPDKLSYDARIMWTPSMHSATWEIATSFFPALTRGKIFNFMPIDFVLREMPFTPALLLLLIVGAILFTVPGREVKRTLCVSLMPTIFAVGYFISFIYIVRYHEFAIIFISISLPMLLTAYLRAFRYDAKKVHPAVPYTVLYGQKRLMLTLRGIIIVLALVSLFVEIRTSLEARRKYTGDVQLQDTTRLIAWFRSERSAVEGKGAAANLTIGPMLKAYAGMGVAMNPQFGLKFLRDATEEYLKIMYHGTEKDLLKYCTERNVKYVIYNKGSVGPLDINSMRYIAGAKKIEAKSPVSRMNYTPDALTWFCRIRPPWQFNDLSKTYTVFKVVTPADKKEAFRISGRGWKCLSSGDKVEAKRLAKEALALDPSNPDAAMLYKKISGHEPTLTLSGAED